MEPTSSGANFKAIVLRGSSVEVLAQPGRVGLRLVTHRFELEGAEAEENQNSRGRGGRMLYLRSIKDT
jgi:hypothetical protein